MTLAARLRAALDHGHSRTIDLLSDDRLGGTETLAPAAVLVAITDRPQPGLILTQRSIHLRKHPGQVAFPGGRVDPEDADEIAGALREAQEELGLPPEHVDVIGVSDRYHTFTGFDIVPVLGVVPPDLPLVPQESEVADWFEMPLTYALDPANRTRRSIHFEGRERFFYEITWQDRKIWGVTAAILANLSGRIGHDRIAA